MSTISHSNVSDNPLELLDIPVPATLESHEPGLSGPPVSPQQRVFFYSPDEWEKFIVEWASGLKESYQQIKQLGGPGDQGVDIAAFKTVNGFEGGWDCYQAKHYARDLSFKDAVPEMMKVFHGVVSGHYCMPDRYVFVSPRGCGSTFNRLLSKPSELQKKFIETLKKRSVSVNKYDDQTLDSIREFANDANFSMFRSLELSEMLETHRSTPYYAARFGTPLPKRPPVKQAPKNPKANESVYIRKLLDVYREKAPGACSDIASVSGHPVYGKQFQRHREDFYSAEALRLYARESVPPGTYEKLQEDVHSGVIETAEGEFVTGLARLQAVLSQSGQLDLSAHALIAQSTIKDRKGICHQLANDDKLTWVIDQ